jgi:tryptophan-specific transport protein
VLYILTYAYITSGGSITENAINSLQGEVQISRSTGSLLFCFVLALFVWLSTKAVDRISTILIGGMVLAFFLSTTGLLSSLNINTLLDNQNENTPAHLPYLLTALPVCLVSFGFHGNVPSLVKYYNREGRRVMQSIFIGTLLALFIYILWQMAVQGNLPRDKFAPVIAKGGDVAALLEALSAYIPVKYIGIALNFFAYMAIASSFLGVTLGLFDYIADLLKLPDTPWGRAKTALLTFLPPLLLSLQFPYGFVIAIGYAGLAATLWAAIVPALLVHASRKKFQKTSYRVYGGKGMIYFIIFFGLINIIAQIGIQMGIIPTFK